LAGITFSQRLTTLKSFHGLEFSEIHAFRTDANIEKAWQRPACNGAEPGIRGPGKINHLN